MESSSLKTIKLLRFFSKEKACFSLQELAERTKYNKTTLSRMLSDLTAGGLLERNPKTKNYHIGQLVMHLEKIRTYDNPMEKIITKYAKLLRDNTQETVHYTSVQQNVLIVNSVFYSKKILRVIVDNVTIPFDKTGSGALFLAYMEKQHSEQIIGKKIPKKLSERIKQCVENGYFINEGNFDKEAISISAPIFDSDSNIINCISVVFPKATSNKKVIMTNKEILLETAGLIMSDIGGIPPKNYLIK